MKREASLPRFKKSAKEQAADGGGKPPTRGRALEPDSKSSTRSESSESDVSLLSLGDMHELEKLEDDDLTNRLNRNLWYMQTSLGDSFPKNVIRKISRPAGCQTMSDRYFSKEQDGTERVNGGGAEELVARGKRQRSETPAGDKLSKNKGHETDASRSDVVPSAQGDDGCLASLHKVMDMYATSDSKILCSFCGQCDCLHVTRGFRLSCKEMRCGLCARRGHSTNKCYQNYSQWEALYLGPLEESYYASLQKEGQEPPLRCLKCNTGKGPLCKSCVRIPSQADLKGSDSRFQVAPYHYNIPLQPSFEEHAPFIRGMGPSRYCKAFPMVTKPVVSPAQSTAKEPCRPPTRWSMPAPDTESLLSLGMMGRQPSSVLVSGQQSMMGTQPSSVLVSGRQSQAAPTTAPQNQFYHRPNNQWARGHPMVVPIRHPMASNTNRSLYGIPPAYYPPNNARRYT